MGWQIDQWAPAVVEVLVGRPGGPVCDDPADV
jgi:hypothetical protein